MQASEAELSPVGTKRALVIAISDYEHLERLKVCEKDGEEVFKLLEKNGYVIQKNHKLIGRVDYFTLRDRLYDFFNDKNITPADTILFYFSGHGIPGDDGEHYFATSEIDPDRPRRRGVSFDDYTDFMSTCNSKIIFSILDCCYSGAAKPSKGNKNAEMEKGESILKEKSKGEGRCTLSACKPMEKSYLFKNHSVFTQFLIEGLQGGQGKSADTSGCVTPDLLVTYIDEKIRSMPPDDRPKQTPFLRCEYTGKLILSQFAEFSKLKVSQPEQTRNTQYYLQKGISSFYKGEYQNAIKDYDKIINDPNYVTALYNKGLVFDKLRKYHDALELYKKALDIYPGYFDALFRMGYTHNNLQKNREAIIWYDKALKIKPNDLDTLYNKGLSLYRLGRYEQSIIWYDKALKNAPNDYKTIYNKAMALDELGKYQEAVTWYDKALKIKPVDTNTLINKGLALYNQDKYQEAVTSYDKALKIKPVDSDAMYNKAMALDELGKYQEAVTWYDKALKIDPKNSDILNNKGWALYNQDKYQEAVTWYDKALKIDPKHKDSLNNKAIALDDLGKYQEAIIWYDKALKIDPKNKDIIDNKKITNRKLAKNSIILRRNLN